MTYEDKAAYDSTPPCTCPALHYVASRCIFPRSGSPWGFLRKDFSLPLGFDLFYWHLFCTAACCVPRRRGRCVPQRRGILCGFLRKISFSPLGVWFISLIPALLRVAYPQGESSLEGSCRRFFWGVWFSFIDTCCSAGAAGAIVVHAIESRRAYEWVMLHTWTRYVACMDKSHSMKRVHIQPKEPYIPRKEPYILRKEPYILPKRAS